MYSDEIEKLKYMRDRIASSMVAAEILPDRITIDKRLADIDTKLALFQHTDIKEGDVFDVKRFNADFLAVYQDLLILYKLVYEYSVKKYNDTKAYIDAHLTQMETYANKYSRKAEFEAGGVSTGKTIFFQGNGFSPVVSNFYCSYDLGKVEVNKGSKITFHIAGRDFDIKDVTFYLNDTSCSAYSLNHDYIDVPGEAAYRQIRYELPEDVIRNSTFPMEISGFTPAINNKYVIYGGRNKICHVDGAIESYYEKEKEQAIALTRPKGKVSFYVVGATYIDMDFAHELLSQNFAGTSIPAPSGHQLVTFEYSAENFAFNINTDGIIYAVCRRGVVKNDTLYYPQADPDIFDFRIEEYAGKDAETKKLSVKIRQMNNKEPYIEMIAVKEQSLFDEVDP